MEDPTGIVLMTGGSRPTEGEIVDRIVIEKGANKGVVVRVSKKPAGAGKGGELSIPVGTDEMNAFGSWPEAAEFVGGLMGGEATEEPAEPEDSTVVDESEDTMEPPLDTQIMDELPPTRRGPVEFAGQRSYGR